MLCASLCRLLPASPVSNRPSSRGTQTIALHALVRHPAEKAARWQPRVVDQRLDVLPGRVLPPQLPGADRGYGKTEIRGDALQRQAGLLAPLDECRRKTRADITRERISRPTHAADATRNHASDKQI
jgi:hypothetical protein